MSLCFLFCVSLFLLHKVTKNHNLYKVHHLKYFLAIFTVGLNSNNGADPY